MNWPLLMSTLTAPNSAHSQLINQKHKIHGNKHIIIVSLDCCNYWYQIDATTSECDWWIEFWSDFLYQIRLQRLFRYPPRVHSKAFLRTILRCRMAATLQNIHEHYYSWQQLNQKKNISEFIHDWKLALIVANVIRFA